MWTKGVCKKVHHPNGEYSPSRIYDVHAALLLTTTFCFDNTQAYSQLVSVSHPHRPAPPNDRGSHIGRPRLCQHLLPPVQLLQPVQALQPAAAQAWSSQLPEAGLRLVQVTAGLTGLAELPQLKIISLHGCTAATQASDTALNKLLKVLKAHKPMRVKVIILRKDVDYTLHELHDLDNMDLS